MVLCSPIFESIWCFAWSPYSVAVLDRSLGPRTTVAPTNSLYGLVASPCAERLSNLVSAQGRSWWTSMSIGGSASKETGGCNFRRYSVGTVGWVAELFCAVSEPGVLC